MRNLKKFLALVLAMMMTLSLMVVANAAPATPTDFADKDTVSSTYAEAVNVLSALGVIKGQGANEAGNFKPKDPITRAETAMMLYRIAHNDAAGAQVDIYKDYDQFPDVSSDKWYAGAVNYCANAELIKGWGGAFHPSDNVTGYEVLAMVLRMIGYGQNAEFQGAGWQIQTARYGRLAGLTKNIQEGTLGQPATREVVAEIMFQSLNADLVDYNMLRNYFPSDVLIENTEDNRAAYKNAIDNNLVTLPLNADLMYVNYSIVGKSPTLAFDSYGRPSEAWVVDNTGDGTTDPLGRAGKYVPNLKPNSAADWDADPTSTGLNGDDTPKLLIALTPVKVYDNAITECNLSKEINGDKSIAWADITEVLNGNATTGATGVGHTQTLNNGRTGNMDALHTTVDYIGATGRTTEIYNIGDVDGDNKAEWIFVYIDTFLGQVIKTTNAIKDSAGHVITPAMATVALGAGTNAVTIDLENKAGYKTWDLVLVQTYGGGETTAINAVTPVTSPEKAPLEPADVPDEATQFVNGTTKYAQLLSTAPTTVEVTINATVGAQDAKMGIIGTDGKTYMASNTFLTGRTGGTNLTVLNDWYEDIITSAGNKGITNSLIGRTFKLVLDQHGYIIGMDEVLTVNSNVGVITGVDNVRIGTGKYLSEVEAYMADGSTQTFQVPMLIKDTYTDDTLATLDSSADASLDETVFGTGLTDADVIRYTFFPTSTEADDAWDEADPMYGKYIGVGSLVKFTQVAIEGKTYWRIDDYDGQTDVKDGTLKAFTASQDEEYVKTDVGTVWATADDNNEVLTGVTDTLFGNTLETQMLDDASVVFVTEYDYRYNTGNANEGSNVNKSYNVYEGFKKLPTIQGTGLVYQRLDKNPEYFLIGKTDACNDYIIKNQTKITVDESYLLLSRGATYAEYSEYNVLKNGELTTLKVANGNNKVNADIEKTLTNSDANIENQLIIVTGTNSKGYVTSIKDTYTISQESNTSDKASLNKNTAGLGVPVILPDATVADGTGALAENDAKVRLYSESVLQLHGDANGFLTIDENCKVLLVNRDLGTTYDISLNEAIRYANGVDKGDGTGTATDPTDANRPDGILPSHGMVFELNELGYVSALYVIDDWNVDKQ